MKRLLVILAILALVYPHWVFALVAIPNFTNWSTGYGVDQDNTWDEILVVTDTTSDGNGADVGSADLNGVTVVTGSFEELIDYHNDNAGVRVMLFEVGGTIECNARVVVTRDGLWIAGQSAPSPGITLKNTTFQVAADNVLVQHIRIRVGDEGGWNPEVSTGARDAFNVTSWIDTYHPKNVHVDHVSISWTGDENIGISTSDFSGDNDLNVTFSNCIISEPLSWPTGYDGTYGNIGFNAFLGEGHYVAIVDSIFAHAIGRSPLIGNGNNKAVLANNILYDMQDFALQIQQYGNDNPIEVSAVGNYSLNKAGSNYSAATYFATFWDGLVADDYEFDSTDGDSFYFDKNSNKIGAAAATVQTNSDDWSHVRERSAFANIAALKTAVTSDTQISLLDTYTPTSAADAYTNNIANAGARPMDRDSVDSRIISDIINLSGTTLVNHPSVVGGWDDDDNDDPAWNGQTATDWDSNTSTDSIGLGYYISTAISGMPNFPNNWTAAAASPYTGYTELEKWLDQMADYWETGTLTDPENKFLNDPNCLHAYFDGNTAIEDGQLNANLNAGAGESEWVNVSTNDDNAYISSTSTRAYYCQAIADAGGITLSKVTIYPDNVGDISGKTLYIHKNTQVGGAGNNLASTPGTQIGSVAGSNAWDFSAVDIDVTDTAFAQNELLCFSMQEVDGANYIKARALTDDEVKLGDTQRFYANGTWYDTPNLDFKIILYESAGTPPAYANSVATFNGSDQFLYQAVTSLHANMVGITAKTNGSFVLQDVSFPSFPTDGNEWTLVKLPNAYDLVVKTSGTDNLLELRVYDGSDWDAVLATTEDLDPDTLYDIQFSIDDTGNELAIDVATSADSTRIEAIREVAFNDTPATPNSGNVTIGYDGSAEFFTGLIGTLIIFDDRPSAAEFIDMVDGEYNEPLPTCTSITLPTESYDVTDIGSYIPVTSIWSKAVSFSGVSLTLQDDVGDIPCWLSSGGGTTTPSLVCGPIEAGMRGVIADKDANFTVSGLLKDELGNDLTTLTIPSISGTATLAIPTSFTIPSGYADYAAVLTAYDHLVPNDTIEVLDKANITITDEDGTSGNPIKIYFRAGYSGTFDLGSNTYWKVFMHPSGTCTNCAGTGVDVEPFNGAAAGL